MDISKLTRILSRYHGEPFERVASAPQEDGRAWVPFAGNAVVWKAGATPPDEVLVVGQEATLDADEAADAAAVERLRWFEKHDTQHMGRMIEDVLVAVASGQPLSRDTFPAALWSKINARRAKRGQQPV